MKGTRPLDNDEIRLVSVCFDGTFATRNRALFMLGVSTGGRITKPQRRLPNSDNYLRRNSSGSRTRFRNYTKNNCYPYR